jgi:hypothetical protein
VESTLSWREEREEEYEQLKASGNGTQLGAFFVDTEDRTKQNRKDNIRYYATLPTAFYVCLDARNAVIPLYPKCFASKLYGPRVRFNLALDTLYLDDLTDPDECKDFLENLSGVEAGRLENLAFTDMPGLPDDDDESYEIWENLDSWLMEKLPGLKTILSGNEIGKSLEWVADNLRWKEQYANIEQRLIEQIPSIKCCSSLSSFAGINLVAPHSAWSASTSFPKS